MANLYGLDKAVVLIHQQDVELFRCEVLHLRQHVVVDTGGGTHVGMQFGCRCLSASAQLYGCEYLTGGLRTHSLGVEDFIETCLAQCVEVAVELAQYVVGNIHCAVLLRTAANEDGKEFSVGQ